jgi:hypothetical protein
VEFSNPGDFDCSFVLCFMLDLKKPNVEMPRIRIGKNKARTEWNCIEQGTSNAPPCFHFGCVQVSIPAHAGRGQPGDPPVVVAPFQNADGSLKSVVQMAEPFDEADLGTVYMDFLKDCPVDDDCNLCMADVFLVPVAPENFDDWVNIWVGGAYFELTGGDEEEPEEEEPESEEFFLATFDFPSGNWVTMGDPDAEYPARLVGQLTGAPPGTLVTFVLPSGDVQVFFVEGDPATCEGTPLDVSLPYLIPADDSQTRTAIQLTMPTGNCGAEREGEIATFLGDVIAEPNSPIYAAGDRIVRIDGSFRKDTVPPVLVTSDSRVVEGGFLELTLRVGDDTSLPGAVNLTFSVNDGTEQVVAVAFQPDSVAPGVNEREFTTMIGPFADGDEVALRAAVSDEGGNTTTEDLDTIVVDVPVTPTCGDEVCDEGENRCNCEEDCGTPRRACGACLGVIPPMLLGVAGFKVKRYRRRYGSR